MAVKPYTEEEREIELKRRIDEVRNTKSTKLDLSGLGLEAIPEAIYDLNWLTELDLGPHESIKEKPYWDYTQNNKKLCNAVRVVPDAFSNAFPHLTHLSLGSNGIGAEGAKALSGLTNLTTLHLGFNEIGSEGAKALSGLTNLTTLHLHHNKIGAEGAKALASLTNLTTLHLNNNRIRADGAKALASLTNLTTLDLRSNDIGSEGAKVLAGLTNLTTLHLNNNRIRADGAKALASLTNLTTLNLSRNGIGAEGAKALANLTNLTTLNLVDNDIGAVGAKALANLTNLTTLYLEFNGTGDEGGKALAGLTNLTTLHLGFNGTGDEGVKALANLTNLTTLDLSSNKIGAEGAKALANLTNLTTLNLSRNGIGAEGAKALANLTNLTTLYLSYYYLNETCEELWMLPLLEKLVLYKSNIKGIPEEILSKEGDENCLPALRAHLKSLQSGAETIRDVKLMVLGNGLIGKTQICRRLSNKGFDERVESTHGIDVSNIDLKSQHNKEEISFHIWDFGGQDIYLGTHSLFLSNRAIFQLVWIPQAEENKYHEYNGQKFRNFPLSYWVNYAKQFGGEDSPVLIVQTQCDTPDCIEQIPPLNNTSLKTFSSAKILQYSAKTNEGRAGLEEALLSAAQHINKQHGEIQIGKGWARVKSRLEEMLEEDRNRPALERKHRTLSQAEFQTICEEEGEGERSQYLLNYLKEVGTVYYQKENFNDQIILDQEWALNAIYTIFNRDKAYKNLQRQGGKFTQSDLGDWIWNIIGHSEKEQDLFLKMMLSCGMCFVHKTAVESKDIEAEYVAPELLPEILPERQMYWDEEMQTKSKPYDYKLLSPALMRNILSHIGSEAGMQAYYWRDGLLVYEANTGSRALIEQQVGDNWEGQLTIKTQKGRAEELLQSMVHIVQEQHRKLGIKPTKEETDEHLPVHEAFLEERYAPRELNYTAEPSDQRKWYVSYGIKTDKTPEDQEEVVDRLCAAAKARNIEIIRDKTHVTVGDNLSRFMTNLAKGDRVFVVLSKKYLESPFCMFELFTIYRNCREDDQEFLKRIRVFTKDCAKIFTLKDRAERAIFWKKEYQSVEALVNENGYDILGKKDYENYIYMKDFALHIGNLLTTVTDILQPKSFEEFLSYGFDEEE